MTHKDRSNRAKWSANQQEAARKRFAETLPSVDQQRAEKLGELYT